MELAKDQKAPLKHTSLDFWFIQGDNGIHLKNCCEDQEDEMHLT